MKLLIIYKVYSNVKYRIILYIIFTYIINVFSTYLHLVKKLLKILNKMLFPYITG